MDMDWQEIKKEIEKYCKKKYAETGIPPIFRKGNIIFHLKLDKEGEKRARRALVVLLKEGKLVKYGSHAYRWNVISNE